MAETIVFPDASAVVTTILTDLGPTGTRIPSERPGLFLRVLRTGGPRTSIVVDAAQITVEAWAASDTAAHDLAQLARGTLHAAEGTTVREVVVYRVDEVSGPADFPDPLSGHSRYTQTFTVHVRGTPQGD